MPDAAVAQPSPEVAPLMLVCSGKKMFVVSSSFCCSQRRGWGLGWDVWAGSRNPAQELLGVTLGAFASREIGRSVPLLKPGTASPCGVVTENPNPFKQRKQKKPALFGGEERARSLWGCCRVASLPAGRAPTQPRAAPARGFFLPTSENDNLIKIDAMSRDLNAMPFKMRNEWK